MENLKLHLKKALNEPSTNSLENVKELRRLLNPNGSHPDCDGKLTNSVFDMGTGHLESVEDICSALDQCSLNQLISYVFNMRFSLAERGTVINGRLNGPPDGNGHQKPEQTYNQLYSELDQIIMWFLCQEINAVMIEGFMHCIRTAKEKAIVRNQTCIHLMEWYRYQIDEHDNVENFRANYEAVKASVLLVIQDVWSAIRNACVSRFSHFAHTFTSDQLEDLFTHLIKICNDETSLWQSKDGAIMGVQNILKVIPWEYCMRNEENVTAMFNLDDETGSWPRVVTRLLPSTVFTLLGHPQLSVREHTVKAYTAYISRSDMEVSVSCFTEVIQQLCVGIDLRGKRRPHLAMTQPHFSFMDPYKAESLLGVCVYLVKHIPAERLLLERAFYFSTFVLYLSHPASTVRQAASTVFKYMVARDSSSPLTLKYIIQGLCCDWLPDMELLLFEQQSKDHQASSQRSSITKVASEGVSAYTCWEWREGRLLAYELIMQFLIKNHWLYTFGSYHFVTDPIESPREEKCHKRTNSLGEENPGNFQHKPRKGAVGKLLEEESRRTRTSSLSSETKAVAITKSELRNAETLRLSRPAATVYSGPRYSISSSSPAQQIAREAVIKEEKSQVLSSSFGTAEFTKARQHRLRRLVTVSGHPSGKDFSYHVNHNAGAKAKKPARKRRIATQATSLLLACKYGGETQDKVLLSPRTLDKHMTEISNPCMVECGEDVSESLEDLASLLERMFYQTVECLADVRWELRRMGQQLLPCLVEVIRWYDMKILEDIWDNQLKSEATVLSYGACLALKFSLVHAARLQHMLKSPPHSWQEVLLAAMDFLYIALDTIVHEDVDACQTVILQIVDPVRWKLDVWSQIIYSMLQERPDYNKFTVVAMETLMLAQSHFDLVASQKSAQLLRVRSVLTEVFTKAHPDSTLAKQLSNPHYSKTFTTPTQGYLSCCKRPENSQEGLAKQVEKYMLSELEHSLPHFVKVADTEHTHILLPVLCAHLKYYMNDDKLTKYLTDSIVRLKTQMINRQRLGTFTPDSSSNGDKEQSVTQALHELCLILSTDNLDLHSFKHTCDLYASVSCAASVPHYLLELVNTLMPKITVVSSPVSTSGCKKPVLFTLSNPPLAPILNEEESSDEDEEEQQIDPSVENMTESQTLNVSTNSGGNMKTGVRHMVPSSGENSENSDWDSWDDEEEQAEDYTEAIKELFVKLEKSINSQAGFDGHKKFRDYVEGLEPKEKKIVLTLLES